MPYLKPPAVTRHVVNPLVARLHPRGVVTLSVPGRRTGRGHTVPVIPVEVAGVRYLVSPYGESDWVRNLRASGWAELGRKGEIELIHTSEVPAGDRAGIIAAYRNVCGRAINPCFTRLPDPRDHPVFRIV